MARSPIKYAMSSGCVPGLAHAQIRFLLPLRPRRLPGYRVTSSNCVIRTPRNLPGALRQHPDNTEARRGSAIGHLKVGDMHLNSSDASGAAQEFRKAPEILDALSKAEPVNVEARRSEERRVGKEG